MHMPTPGYANKNPFAAPRNENIVCYDCIGFGHRNYECKKKNSPSYGNWWNHPNQLRSSYMTYEQQRPAWNKMKSVPAHAMNSRKLVTGQNGMVRKGREN